MILTVTLKPEERAGLIALIERELRFGSHIGIAPTIEINKQRRMEAGPGWDVTIRQQPDQA